MRIRIVLADDHKIVRDDLRNLLEKQKDMKLIGEADNGRTAVQLVENLIPDVAIVDISMPELNGIEAAHQIVHTVPSVKLIALSMYSERRFIMGMLKAGASGYLLKDCAFDELCTAIRAVYNQQTYLSPGVESVIAQDFIGRFSDEDLSSPAFIEKLEKEVIQHLAAGKTPEEIASNLSIGSDRVVMYRQNMIKKWISKDNHEI